MVVDEEWVWINKIKTGNYAPFQDLYARHADKLFGLCFRFTGNQADAEDQLQEVFVKILAKIDGFRAESSFATWAYRLATNHLLNFGARRKERHEADLEEAAEPGVGGTDVPLTLALEQAVRALPEGYRRVFIMHDQEGFKHEEIGAVLGISPATSRSQLARARLALRDQLKPMLQGAKEGI